MSLKVITRCCYSCDNCQVQKKICKKHTKVIQHIYSDICNSYTKRCLTKCEICGRYVVKLESHLKRHNLTLSNYNAIIGLKKTKKRKLTERRLF